MNTKTGELNKPAERGREGSVVDAAAITRRRKKGPRKTPIGDSGLGNEEPT